MILPDHGLKPPVNHPKFWQEAEQAGLAHWNLATPTPVLLDLLNASHPRWLRPGRLVVPGFGHGWDAVRFAAAGFSVVGFDFADYAVRHARKLAERAGVAERASFHQADLFTLGPEWNAGFDHWLEYTCFCAIDPARRAEYVATAARLLKRGGLLTALFFPVRDSGSTSAGPPFSMSDAEIRRHFADGFTEEYWLAQPPLSVARRREFERLVQWRRL